MVTRKIIRVPEKLYIETLIVGGMSPEMVVSECQRLNIEPPLNELEDILNEVLATIPNIKDPDEYALIALEIAPMYCYRFNKPAPSEISLAGCEEALKMTEDPQLKKIIIGLSLAGINPNDIELLINGRYHVTHEQPDFQNYIKYFANFEEWSYADKEAYVEKLKDAEFKNILRKAALKGDRHYLVWKLGLGTDPHMSMEQIFTDMMADSYFTFKENIKLRPEDAQKFAQLAIRLSDRLDQTKSKEKESHNLLDELKIKLEVETTDKKENVVDLKDISIILPKRAGGNQSINLEGLKFE